MLPAEKEKRMMERNLDKEAFEHIKRFILLANADDKHSECCAILNIMKERGNMIEEKQEFIGKLSKTEKLIFNCLINGEDNYAITKKLNITHNNCRVFIAKILKKASIFYNLDNIKDKKSYLISLYQGYKQTDEKKSLENDDILINLPLTEKETEILDCLLDGLDYKEIAEKLFISPTTVKTHANNIFSKKNINSLPKLIASEYKERLKTGSFCEKKRQNEDKSNILTEKFKQLEKENKEQLDEYLISVGVSTLKNEICPAEIEKNARYCLLKAEIFEDIKKSLFV